MNKKKEKESCHVTCSNVSESECNYYVFPMFILKMKF